MSAVNVRRILLFVPLVLAVACSSPTGPKYPQPKDPPPPAKWYPPTNAGLQPTTHDTLHVQAP